MPYVASIGTYLPCWGTAERRVPGDDEDAITLAVEAGRAALQSRSRRSNASSWSAGTSRCWKAAMPRCCSAGLGLDPELEVTERLGGAPATLDALSSARPRTLVIGVDLEPAGAAAAAHGRSAGCRCAPPPAWRAACRSDPQCHRRRHDYGDPRLLHERGLVASLAAAWLDTPAAVAGVDDEHAADLCLGNPPPLPTTGASSGLFALAGDGRGRNHRTARRRRAGQPVGYHGQRRASPPCIGASRRPRDMPAGHIRPTALEIPISLAAYERAFEAKLVGRPGSSQAATSSTSRRATGSTTTVDCATRIRHGAAAADRAPSTPR